jgi:hypothetical protein
MSSRDREKRVVILAARGEIRNREGDECALSVGRVVLLLRDAGIVEAEVREIRRDVARCAVSRVLRAVGCTARRGEKNLQPRELRRTELEWLRVIFELSVGAVDPDRIRESQQLLIEVLIVLLIGFAGARLLRQVIDPNENVVR